MANKCLVCYEAIADKKFYHERCSHSLFRSDQAPFVDFGADDIEKLALRACEKIT